MKIKVPELDPTGWRDVGKEPWRDDWTDGNKNINAAHQGGLSFYNVFKMLF